MVNHVLSRVLWKRIPRGIRTRTSAPLHAVKICMLCSYSIGYRNYRMKNVLEGPSSVRVMRGRGAQVRKLTPILSSN